MWRMYDDVIEDLKTMREVTKIMKAFQERLGIMNDNEDDEIQHEWLKAKDKIKIVM